MAFVEVHAHATIDALAARDVKGLYKKALAGEIGELHRRLGSVRGADRTRTSSSAAIEETIDESLTRILGALADARPGRRRPSLAGLPACGVGRS